MNAVREELFEKVVMPARNPTYERYGLSIPKGILLYGPPGCGKTWTVNWLAEELKWSLFQVSTSDVGSPLVHKTASNITSIFNDARKETNAIVFADEFDTLVSSREASGSMHYQKEELGAWMRQIDASKPGRPLVIVATNMPDCIDRALVRQGRLELHIYVGAPERDDLLEMTTHHMRSRQNECTSTELAKFADLIAGKGYSSSDLITIINNAARTAVRQNVPIQLSYLRSAAQSVRPTVSPDARTRWSGLLSDPGSRPTGRLVETAPDDVPCERDTTPHSRLEETVIRGLIDRQGLSRKEEQILRALLAFPTQKDAGRSLIEQRVLDGDEKNANQIIGHWMRTHHTLRTAWEEAKDLLNKAKKMDTSQQSEGFDF